MTEHQWALLMLWASRQRASRLEEQGDLLKRVLWLRACWMRCER